MTRVKTTNIFSTITLDPQNFPEGEKHRKEVITVRPTQGKMRRQRMRMRRERRKKMAVLSLSPPTRILVRILLVEANTPAKPILNFH
jgi:hypothetical protein